MARHHLRGCCRAWYRRGVAGFGLGVYFLPILTAVLGLDAATVRALADSAERRGKFVRDLPGSDVLHWGMAPSC